jgi:hypothetical protein
MATDQNIGEMCLKTIASTWQVDDSAIKWVDGGFDWSPGKHHSQLPLKIVGCSIYLTPNLEAAIMARFYEPDLTSNSDSPFIRDGADKLVRRSYWLDMDDRTLVMVMVNGIGANLTNDKKRAHLADLRRENLIDQVCVQEILPPEK